MLATDQRLKRYLKPTDVAGLAQKFPRREGAQMSYGAANETVAALLAAGVPILAGTDAPNPPHTA